MRTRHWSLIGLVLFAAITACSHAQIPVTEAPQKPTLVVLITIDGFREDNLTRFGPQLTGGLARLTKNGAWFTNAHQDHGITETAPGHASLLSGRFPRSTGIAANRVGVADETSPLLGFSGVLGASPNRFQGTTLFDWLKAADSKSRALSISSKDRGAILPIGRAKEQVYWYPGDGEFTTSRYYTATLPDWVDKFNNKRLPAKYASVVWNPLLPRSAYTERDSVAAEGNGLDFVFPHVMPADSNVAASYVRATPFIDELVVAMALDGVQALQLGKGPTTDLLAISLSGSDAINHRLGPMSMEAHDQVLRTDKTIGIFLDSLFRLRNQSRVVVVLSADHGFTPIPETAPDSINPRPRRASLLPALAATRRRMASLKIDTLALEVDQQIVLMNKAAFAKVKNSESDIVDFFRQEALKTPGIARVDRFADLARDSATDPVARRWSHQFPANTNVALVATLTPGSLWGTLNVASHGSPYNYDSNVPVIFMGQRIAAGQYADFVRTVDIAPTLARLLGVKPLEKLDGIPLTKALR